MEENLLGLDLYHVRIFMKHVCFAAVMAHAFCVGDRSHPQAQEIYAMLEKMSWEMKVAGYFSNPELALSRFSKTDS